MYFQSLQIFRAFAAIAVVLYHVHSYIKIMVGQDQTMFSVFGNPFANGVRYFFVLSGFLMAYLLANHSKKFLLRRLVRIYPPYWIAVILVLFIKILIYGTVSHEQLYKSISLLPLGTLTYPLSIEWTLIYEVFFYFVCAVFSFKYLQKIFKYFLITWLVIIILTHYLISAPTEFLPTLKTIFTSSFNVLFIMGGLSYSLFQWLRPVQSMKSVISGLTVVGAGSVSLWLITSRFMPLSILWENVALGICFAAIIIIACLYDQQRASRHISRQDENPSSWQQCYSRLMKVGERLGDYSYAMYLIHVPVITIIFSVSKNFLGLPINSALGLLACAVTLILSVGYGMFDLKLHRYLKTQLLQA